MSKMLILVTNFQKIAKRCGLCAQPALLNLQ